jgi:hypothetical protein
MTGDGTPLGFAGMPATGITGDGAPAGLAGGTARGMTGEGGAPGGLAGTAAIGITGAGGAAGGGGESADRAAAPAAASIKLVPDPRRGGAIVPGEMLLAGMAGGGGFWFMGKMTAVREGGAIELVFFWGASGSTMAGVSAGGGEGGLEDWLDKMMGPRGEPPGSGSSFRERAFGAAASVAVFFIGGGGTIAFAGRGGVVSSVFASGTTAVPVAGSEGCTVTSAGRASRAVTWVEPSSGGRVSMSAATPAPTAAAAPVSRTSFNTGVLLSAALAGTTGTVGVMGGVLLGKREAISPVRTFGGGVGGALVLAAAGGGMGVGGVGGTAGVAATGGGTEGVIGADFAAGGGIGGVPEAPNMGADFFCGGGMGGALGRVTAGGSGRSAWALAGSEGVGEPKIGADLALGAGAEGACAVEVAGLAAPNIGADFLCGGGGKGDALAAAGAAGVPKIWEVFLCGGDKGGALGAEADDGGFLKI